MWTCSRTKRSAILLGLVFTAILLLAAPAAATEIVYWNPVTTYTDGTTIDAGTIAKLKYYIRTAEPNGKTTTPDGTGQYYIGETTTGGAAKWPEAGGLDNVLQGLGNAGKTLTFTVSVGYFDANNKWRESGLSGGYQHLVPFPEGKIPAAPAGLGTQ